MKRLISILLSLMFVFSFTSCSFESGELASYRPITDVNNLEGRRVGCVVGWETDYILTGRDDLTLRRYDSIGEMVMGLCYKQLDAVAADSETILIITNAVDGVEVVEPAIAEIGFNAMLSVKNKDLVDEFNAWIAEFQKTEEYEEYTKRNEEFDGVTFYPIEVEEAKNPTKEITVGYTELYYPSAYTDLDGIAKGTDLEIMRFFARDRGYKINFLSCADTSVGEYLKSGKIDFYSGGITDVYKDDYESTGYYLMTDPFRLSGVYLVQVTDFDKLSMKAAIED